MLHALRARATYANVMATLAVFIALGGAGYAAISLPKNSVKAKQIARNAIKRAEIARGGVASAEVRNRSLRALDFAVGELPEGEPGPPGEPGAQGEQGAQGPVGPVSADVGGSSPNDPVSSPDEQIGQQFLVTTTAAGRLLLLVDLASVTVNCSAGPAHGGIYLDGARVPGGRVTLPNPNTPVHLNLVTDSVVPAGDHDIRFKPDCPNAGPPGWGVGSPQTVAAVVLGS
jgi:hypothetical protein